MHEWMRNEKVDILKYLPKFLSKDEKFHATNDSDSEEHERIRLILQEILDQLYVETATWGLEKWEKLCGIPTNTALSDGVRRANILSKLRNPESVTEIFLNELINRYIADKQGYIINYPKEYRVELLYHGGQILDYEKLREAIRIYLPAHIGYKLITISQSELHYHGAGTVQCFRKNSIDMTLDYNITASDAPMHIAGRIVNNYKLVKISGGAIGNGQV